MKAGTMEGLIGANANMKMANVPMRVYREAERKGDTGAMERAMGYVGEFTQKAHEYKDIAEEELLKEMKEKREEQNIKQEEVIAISREEAKELQEDMTEKVTSQHMDTVTISEDGKKILIENDTVGDVAPKLELTDTKLYSSAGKTIETNTPDVKISVSV